MVSIDRRHVGTYHLPCIVQVVFVCLDYGHLRIVIEIGKTACWYAATAAFPHESDIDFFGDGDGGSRGVSLEPMAVKVISKNVRTIKAFMEERVPRIIGRPCEELHSVLRVALDDQGLICLDNAYTVFLPKPQDALLVRLPCIRTILRGQWRRYSRG